MCYEWRLRQHRWQCSGLKTLSPALSYFDPSTSYRFTLKRSIASLQDEIKDYEAAYGTSEEITNVAKFEAHLRHLDLFIGPARLGRIDVTALYTDLNKVLTEHRNKLLSDMQRSLEIIEEELDKL